MMCSEWKRRLAISQPHFDFYGNEDFGFFWIALEVAGRNKWDCNSHSPEPLQSKGPRNLSYVDDLIDFRCRITLGEDWGKSPVDTSTRPEFSAVTPVWLPSTRIPGCKVCRWPMPADEERGNAPLGAVFL